MNVFSKRIQRQLADKGIKIIGLQAVPAFEGDIYNTGTGYCIDNNGTHQIKTFSEVLELAN